MFIHLFIHLFIKLFIYHSYFLIHCMSIFLSRHVIVCFAISTNIQLHPRMYFAADSSSKAITISLTKPPRKNLNFCPCPSVIPVGLKYWKTRLYSIVLPPLPPPITVASD